MAVPQRVNYSALASDAGALPDATGEPPGRSEASRTNLPECQQPPVKACSKDAPDPQPMRGGRCMWRPHLFRLGCRLDARWQEAWHRHDYKSCKRCSSRASSPHLLSRMTRQWRDFFLRCRAVATAVAVARAASCGTQRASPVNARMPTWQSDGVDLSPANLSCPEV